MDAKKLMEILDKNINQEQLGKDLAAEYVLPLLKDKLMSVDVIPGTDLDKVAIEKVVEFVESMIKGA